MPIKDTHTGNGSENTQSLFKENDAFTHSNDSSIHFVTIKFGRLNTLNTFWGVSNYFFSYLGIQRLIKCHTLQHIIVTYVHYNVTISLQSRDIHRLPGSCAKILNVKMLFVFIDTKRVSFEYKKNTRTWASKFLLQFLNEMVNNILRNHIRSRLRNH